MRTFFERPRFVRADFDPPLNAVIVHWLDLSDGDLVMECTLAQLDEVRKGAQLIIVDTSKASTVLDSKVEDWFGKVLFPRLRDAGLKAIITVLSPYALTRLSSTRWSMLGTPLGLQTYETGSLASAMALAKQLKTESAPARP